MLDYRLLVRVRLPRLVLRLVLLRLNSLQVRNYADAAHDRCWTGPRQPHHRRSHGCLEGLSVLLLSGVWLGHGLFDARYQLRPLHADQTR